MQIYDHSCFILNNVFLFKYSSINQNVKKKIWWWCDQYSNHDGISRNWEWGSQGGTEYLKKPEAEFWPW